MWKLYWSGLIQYCYNNSFNFSNSASVSAWLVGLDGQFLTWSVAEHPEVRLLFCQHFEHHISGSLAGAVQHPGAKRLHGTQRGDVDHTASQPWTLWKSLQHAGSEAQRGADIKRQVGVHLGHVGEASGVAGHITQRGWEEREGGVTRVFPSSAFPSTSHQEQATNLHNWKTCNQIQLGAPE